MASRYCETDLLSSFAWSQFGGVPEGWARVQAICDYVHGRLKFSYPDARETRTAAQAMEERIGVCRDFAHLAIALCRAMNVPARFCNGYLGDIGVPPIPRRWTSTPGSRPISAAAGTRSTPGTISRGSDGSSFRGDATPRT